MWQSLTQSVTWLKWPISNILEVNPQVLIFLWLGNSLSLKLVICCRVWWFYVWTWMNCQVLGLDIGGSQSNNSCFPNTSSNFADINIHLHFLNPCVQIMFIYIWIISYEVSPCNYPWYCVFYLIWLRYIKYNKHVCFGILWINVFILLQGIVYSDNFQFWCICTWNSLFWYR